MKRFITISFVAITIAFLGVIIKLYLLDSKHEYQKSIQAVVIEINSVRGRPKQRTAKLSDGTSIDLPNKFISLVQIGDSIIKNSNSNKYILKLNSTSIYITTEE